MHKSIKKPVKYLRRRFQLKQSTTFNVKLHLRHPTWFETHLRNTVTLMFSDNQWPIPCQVQGYQQQTWLEKTPAQVFQDMMRPAIYSKTQPENYTNIQ